MNAANLRETKLHSNMGSDRITEIKTKTIHIK